MRQGHEGFTLLETLVALAIAAIGLGTVFASFGDGASQARRAEIATLRVLEAWSLAEAAAAGALAEGAAGRLSTGESWAVVASEPVAMPADFGATDFTPLALAVVIHDGAREALRLDALRLDPPPGAGGD